MQKILKNCKQIFALVMAFAVVAVSLVTGAAIDAAACDVTKIDYWDGTAATSFASGSGTADDPYIIETAEQLAYCCLKQNPNTSSNMYYKVSDNVKTFIMQPESIVDLDTLMSLATPDAVKAYFDGLEGKKNWISQFNRQSFNGNFDGNGATVYGLYATSEDTQAEDVGLFPQYDGGAQIGNRRYTNTCKNIAVKNSYYYSKRRLGGIVGASYGTSYGAKFDGKVTIDSCAVVNCYMEAIGNWNFYMEQGIIACGGSKDTIVLDKILVQDVYAYSNDVKANINIVGSASDVKKSGQYPNTVSNSIFLGSAPYGLDYYVDKIHEPYAYTNVVTDFPTGKVALATPTWESKTTQKDYTDHIFSVTEKGAAFKTAASMLDWKNTWFMTENGPELRIFHSNIELITTHTTHLWKCDCCGLESAGGVTEHNFVLVGAEVKGDGTDVYMCSECEYICQHNEQSEQSYDPGDCVTASGYYSRCKFCDWYIVTDVGGVTGHKLTYVAADPGHCELNGHKEYWYCEVCGNKFVSDSVMAPMNSAVSDEWLDTGLGAHIKDEDGDGVIVLYDKNGHWYKCAVNGGRLDADSNALADDEVIKHKFKDAVCTDCGYKCTQHEYVATEEISVMHSCENDEQTVLKCQLCGHKTSGITKKASHTIVKVAEVKPTDRMEGTKAHYKCEVCKEVYGDAEGKTKVTSASLVIPKVLPEEYRNMVNGDSGNKSPSTGDNFSSVLSMAVLAGAVLLIARKK